MVENDPQLVVIRIRQGLAGNEYGLSARQSGGYLEISNKGKPVEICITNQPDQQIFIKEAGVSWCEKPVKAVVLDEAGFLGGKAVLLSINGQKVKDLFYEPRDRYIRNLYKRMVFTEKEDLYYLAHYIAGEEPRRFSLREKAQGVLLTLFFQIAPDLQFLKRRN